MAALGKAIGMNVIAWTFIRRPAQAARIGVELVELDDLLRSARTWSASTSATDQS